MDIEELVPQPLVESDTEQTFDNQCLKNGKKLYLNAAIADVHFTFGAGGKEVKRTPAHRAILAGNSDVFDAMFCGDLKEAGDVHVPDSNEAAFMEFLQYFYLSKVKLTAGNVAGVLHLGEKYDVKKCVDDCIRFLIRTLSNGNVCAYLGLAILYGKKQLMEVCEKKILLNTAAVLDSDGFLECDKTVMAHILKMDVLSCAEDEVFKACMAWVKARSDGADPTIELVERHLGELDQHIRFASLTMDQLCALQEQYEWVLTRDFIRISKMILHPEPGALKRHAKWDAEAIIKCDRRAKPPIGDDERDSDKGEFEDFNDEDELNFSVSETFMMGSLSFAELFARDGWTLPYPLSSNAVEMEITESTMLRGSNKKNLMTMKIELESKSTDILLRHPILIRPGFFYAIRFGRLPRYYGYYSTNMKREVQLKSDITIRFYDYYGFIPVLNFNKI